MNQMNGPQIQYAWKPFADLPEDGGTLTDGELGPLHRVWTGQRSRLEQNGLLEEFSGQLQREWAIETGIIEQIYTLDRGTTQLLIERGIDASLISRDSTDKDPGHVARIVQDHADTLEALFAFIKGQRNLTTGYIKELHAALLLHQETITAVDRFGREFEKRLERGTYKTLPNSPTRRDGTVHEYCPPEHVASEMDRMIALHEQHLSKGVAAEVEAAWLHHVFTQIHPFEDGNGRVARALASLIFLKASWFPVVVTREDREKYISALEAADAGDLRPLISLFVQSQKRSLIKATEIASDVKPPLTVDEAIAAARDRLINKGQIVPKEWIRAKDTARRLHQWASERLQTLTVQLHSEIGVARPEFEFSTTSGSGENLEVLEVAKQLNYVASLSDFNLWTKLKLKTERTARIVVSFHGVGAKYLGVLAATVFLYEEGMEPNKASDNVFQMNYEEDTGQAEKRFGPWLEQSLTKALDLWRRSL
jgi:Fic family protein